MRDEGLANAAFASNRLLLAAQPRTIAGPRFAFIVYWPLIREPRSPGLANGCRLRNCISRDEEVGCEDYLV